MLNLFQTMKKNVEDLATLTQFEFVSFLLDLPMSNIICRSGNTVMIYEDLSKNSATFTTEFCKFKPIAEFIKTF